MLRNRSYRLSQPVRRSPVLVVLLVLAAAAILAADQAGLLGPLRVQAHMLISPALRGLQGVSDWLGSFSRRLDDDLALRAEVEALRAENAELKARIIEAEALKFENARLREQVRIEQAYPWQLLGADVLALTPDTGRRLMLIAAGADQGVQPGMAVIAREGSNPPALIGVVETVGPQTASVLLITDYSSVLSAQVYHGTNVTRGVVQGQWQRGSRLLLHSVARDAPLDVGNTVVTAGLSAELAFNLPRAFVPPNVPVGTVETVQETGRERMASVRLFVDPDRVRYAWVILASGELRK
ncbi:MAG: rod shape-determining protein MreC [Roseiflexus sp.]|nr:rod shape-determining protein MreC [Roseiflexus sp.]MCS7288988.1 rod shape-determining protein MreC [Roseiflexus sp.]MDW8147105.1 rod shape-determining protein MreC [Roseiflexaceae bacterium]MDW8231706.1 rod shape-determining protein MreC [Roseiflexaceae bacterium]